MDFEIPRFERHMSDSEALMWNLEKDPRLISSFASVSILDREPDLEQLRKRMTRAADALPRLRQRVAPPFGRLAPPEWVDDREFDIEYHVRAEGLATGTVRHLLDQAALEMSDPFVRTRPLWQFIVYTGLDDGKAALFQKMHHTITDGEGGVQLWAQFVDLERSPADAPTALDAASASATAPARHNLAVAGLAAVRHATRRQIGLARRAARATANTVRHPAEIPAGARDVATTLHAVTRQLTTVAPGHSPLWNDRTARRRFEILSVPFRPVRDASKNMGYTMNDFFVAAAAGATGAYHRRLDAPVEALRMAMPVSTRTSASSGGNSFALTRIDIPTTADPAARLANVAERLRETKADRSLAVFEEIAGLANLLPTNLLVQVALRQAKTIDFTTSNVRASNFGVYIAGAKMEHNYPFGPMAGTPLNITLLSYDGHLDVGFNIDSGAVRDPDLLRECLADAIDEQIALWSG